MDDEVEYDTEFVVRTESLGFLAQDAINDMWEIDYVLQHYSVSDNRHHMVFKKVYR